MTGETKKASVSSLQKGSYMIMAGVASRVTDISISRPGKHGHAKARITAVGIFDEKKRVEVMPGHDAIDVPIIGKKTAQVLSISGDTANVMDAESYETFDLKIPTELKDTVTEGCNILYWEVLDDKVMKSIKES